MTIKVISWVDSKQLRKVDGKIYFEKPVENNIVAVSKAPCEPAFEIPYIEEFYLNGQNDIHWQKISVDSPEGFFEITDKYDVAQIYANGQLVADSFYYGPAWRNPASIIYGNDAYLLTSDFREDVYID